MTGQISLVYIFIHTYRCTSLQTRQQMSTRDLCKYSRYLLSSPAIPTASLRCPPRHHYMLINDLPRGTLAGMCIGNVRHTREKHTHVRHIPVSFSLSGTAGIASLNRRTLAGFITGARWVRGCYRFSGSLSASCRLTHR